MAPKAPVTVTVSIGVTSYSPNEPMEGAINRADIAAYQAKNAGRNRIVAIVPEEALPLRVSVELEYTKASASA